MNAMNDIWIWLALAILWFAQYRMSKVIDQQQEYINSLKEFFDKYLIKEE